MSYRLAIFDFDGTLVDSLPWFQNVFAGVAREFGLRPVDSEERQRLRGLHPREILARLGVPVWKVPRISRRFRQLKAVEAHRLPLFPGVEELLRDLAHRRVPRAIVSSDAEANVRLTLGPDNAALIDLYACGASLFGKPRKLRQVLKHFAMPRHQGALRRRRIARRRGRPRRRHGLWRRRLGLRHARCPAATAARSVIQPHGGNCAGVLDWAGGRLDYADQPLGAQARRGRQCERTAGLARDQPVCGSLSEDADIGLGHQCAGKRCATRAPVPARPSRVTTRDSALPGGRSPARGQPTGSPACRARRCGSSTTAAPRSCPAPR